MSEVFKEGKDLHALAAMSITGKEDPAEITPEERQLAKAVNFGLVYGMGVDRLIEHAASGFGVAPTQELARHIRRVYFKTFTGLRSWHRRQANLTSTTTIMGRRRDFEGKSPFTQLLNTPVQGSGADGLKLALVKLWETRGSIGSFPVLSVHDELVVETPEDKVDEAKEWLIAAMTEGMGEILREVPVVVETRVSSTWG